MLAVTLQGADRGDTATLDETLCEAGMAVAEQVGREAELRPNEHANAEVVYVDPEQPMHCGIALALPKNIWGMSLPPDDWHEADPR